MIGFYKKWIRFVNNIDFIYKFEYLLLISIDKHTMLKLSTREI